jgi:hypothetical protein
MMVSTKQGKQDNQDNQSTQQGNRTSQRGFASMDPNQQRAIASEGGRAAHRSGNAHEFTSEEARRAGSMSHKNSNRQNSAGNQGSESSGNQGESSMRGGSSAQHAEAGRQSHKNQK